MLLEGKWEDDRLPLETEVLELRVVPELEPSIDEVEPEEADCKEEWEVVAAIGDFGLRGQG